MKRTYVPFRDTKTFEERKLESTNITRKYPDRVPVIVEADERINLDKHKYLVPADLTVGQFMYVLRKRCHISPEESVFLFVSDILPPTSALMSQIYHDNRDTDGFMYCRLMKENTFGNNY